MKYTKHNKTLDVYYLDATEIHTNSQYTTVIKNKRQGQIIIW